MEVEDENRDMHVDYQLHNKFWTLIQFLQDPATALKPEDSWNKMIDCLTAVLGVFSSNSKEVAGIRDLKTESTMTSLFSLKLKGTISRNSSHHRNSSNWRSVTRISESTFWYKSSSSSRPLKEAQLRGMNTT